MYAGLIVLMLFILVLVYALQRAHTDNLKLEQEINEQRERIRRLSEGQD